MRLIVLFFMCFSLLANAQESILLEDNFDLSNGWYVGNSEKVSAEVSDGHYIIKHKLGEGKGWNFHKKVNLDVSSDFHLETKLKKTDGHENQSYGVFLRDDSDFDSQEGFYFLVTSTGYFKIYNYHDGRKDKPYVDWTLHPSISKQSEYNKLEIKRKGVEFTFYINNQEVFKCNRKFIGSTVGFVVYDISTIEVDYLVIKHKEKQINLLPDVNKGYKKENLGNLLNSPYTDKTPVISPDGKTMYFSRDKDPENVSKEHSDIWYSELGSDNTWSKSKSIGTPLNNSSHNFVISVTPDGNSLFLGNKYKSDGSPDGGGASISRRTANGWSLPESVVINNYKNLSKYVGYSLSADGKTLIVSVETEDGYGDLDMYVSFLQSDNTFSTPLNLGPIANSSCHDFGPYLAPDNKTLYFSSLGHKGYGGSDIFITRRLDDTWTNWSEPQNLGTDINSTQFDAYYTVSALGDYAYVVSTENSIGSSDIFRIQLAESAKPEPVALIYGNVINTKTNSYTDARISYYDLKSNIEIGIAQSSISDGSYKIVLPYGKEYSFLAIKDGFYSISQNIDLTSVKQYTEIKRDLYLSPIEQGQAIRLNNLFFDTNKSELKSESFAELDRLVILLNQNKAIKISIEGHTDSQGNEEYNQKLSENRAKSVVNYLISKGIDSARISSKGYGKLKPIVPNDSEENMAQNRRVEFIIKEI